MVVKPFKGFRPRKDVVERFIVKPYDIVSREEARKEIQKNPISFYKVTKPEAEFTEDIDPSSDDVMRKARKNLEKFMSDGILVQDDRESFYVYRQIMGKHIQTGLVALFSVDEYLEGKIKKHELTRKKKEEERTKHVYYTKAHTGPVFLMYRSDSEVNESFQRVVETKEPENVLIDDAGIVHEFYVIDDKRQVESIKKAFEKVQAFYIADGHHRAAAAVRASDMLKGEVDDDERNYFLGIVFPHDELRIMDYNRIVKHSIEKKELLRRLEKDFEIERVYERPYRPKKKHEIGLYVGSGEWYIMKPLNVPEDTLSSLDVEILQKKVLSPIFGIEDPRTDERIDFVGGIKGLCILEKLVDEEGWDFAFSMYPTSVEDLMKIADEGKIMPPKSTWFEPKLKSGFVVHIMG